MDLVAEAGEITCIVGSNGAGKTTLLRTISGLLTATAGRLLFGGNAISNLSPEAILTLGVVHVPEGRRLFKGLTVRDNLLLGAYLRRDPRDIQRDLEAAFELFPILGERQRQDATTLSGGEQQMCAIARGIMARLKLLMIDELSLGLARRMVEHLSKAASRDPALRHHDPPRRAGCGDCVRTSEKCVRHGDRSGSDISGSTALLAQNPGSPRGLPRLVATIWGTCFGSPSIRMVLPSRHSTSRWAARSLSGPFDRCIAARIACVVAALP